MTDEATARGGDEQTILVGVTEVGRVMIDASACAMHVSTDTHMTERCTVE